MLGVITFGLISSSTFALDWSPELVQLKNAEFRKPLEIFQIKIPTGISKKAYQSLAFELDNIDITAMIIRKGELSYYTPVKALKWGKHTLRLVEYSDDGSIIEKGFWEVEVRDSSVFQEVDYIVDSNITISHRVADKNLALPKPDTFSAQGAAKLLGRVANNDWEIKGNTNLIYNSEPSQTVHRRELDIADYLLTAQSNTSQFNLGHHNLTQNNFIISDFNRRGVSASTGIDSINSTATGFIMRAEAISGIKDGLGLSDENNKVTGVSWESQPITENPEKLYLSASYLSGKKNKLAESEGAIQADQKGDAWTLVADSRLYKQQLRVRFEYAESINDIVTANTSDIDIINGKGYAHSFLATYSPQSENKDSSFFWNTGLEISKVSTLFASIANPGLPNDKSLNRLFLNTNWTNISAQFLVAKETDNVDEDPTKPQIGTDLYQALLNYNLAEKPEKGTLFDSIGIPTLSFQLSSIDQNKIKDTLLPSGDIRLNTLTKALSLGFAKEGWSWAWVYSKGDLEDKVNTSNNTLTDAHNLSANIKVSKQLSLTSSIQSQDTLFSSDNNHSNTMLYNFGVNYHFTKRLTAQINLNQSITKSDSMSSLQDVDIAAMGFKLNWKWIKAKNNKPGFDLFFSGAYQNTIDKLVAGQSLETYQAYIGVTMTLPSSSIK